MRQTKRRTGTRRKSATRKMIKGGCWFTRLSSLGSRESGKSSSKSSSKSNKSSGSNKSNRSTINSENFTNITDFTDFLKDDAADFISEYKKYNEKFISIKYCKTQDYTSKRLLKEYKNRTIGRIEKMKNKEVIDWLNIFVKTYCVTIKDVV